ncbi:MAG TPA: lysylphosphatidylglycerol synthase transmembrane domain-containing protein [Thermomicrobiales bacterium]|nr:lysylphosphatidylglycerol synthase transmembrane domain-containing protein [Thermomicrobiales bacterium]
MTNDDPSLAQPEERPEPVQDELQSRGGIRGYLDRLKETPGRRAQLQRYFTIGWLTVLGISVAYVLFRGRGELRSTWDQLQNADLTWILIAILIQALMLIFNGMTYKVILKRLGYSVPLPMMVNAHMQRTTISTVTPGGGPASVFIFARFIAKRGVPAEDGLLTIAVRTLAVAITFIAVLIPGAAIDDSLQGMIISAIGVIALIVGGIALWRGNANNWQTPLAWSERLPSWAKGRIQGFITTFRDHGLKPSDLVPAIVLTLLVRLTVVLVLFACLKALGVHPTFQTMINTYFASIVAGAVIPLFGGAGAVEAVSILSLKQAGIPGDVAIGATLLWRFIDLWIPVGIGLLLHAKTELPAAIDETPVIAAKMVELKDSGRLR